MTLSSSGMECSLFVVELTCGLDVCKQRQWLRRGFFFVNKVGRAGPDAGDLHFWV